MGKVIVLGIDALNETLLDAPGMKKLKDVFAKNSSGTLKSVHPPTTDAAWTSFQTGKDPDEHGICGFVDFTSMEQPLYTRNDIIYPTFYDLIDQTSRKQMVFNLPFTYPPTISGDIIYSWVDHGFPQNRPYAPTNLHVKYPFLKDIEIFPPRKDTAMENLKEMKRYFSDRAKIIRKIVDNDAHDFYFFLISVTDWIQHIAFDDIVNQKKSDEYRICNEILAEVSELCLYIIGKAKEEDSIIMMSDHGFGIWNKTFNVNTWLLNVGYLITNKEGKTMSNVLRRRVRKKGKKEICLGRIGDWMREHKNLRRRLSFLERLIKRSGMDLTTERKIDFENSKAVCFSKLSSSIFVNEGKVDDKEKLISELITRLNQLDGVTAKTVDELYGGKMKKRMGDIIVRYKHGVVSNRLEPKVFGNKAVTGHDYNGVYCFIGKMFTSKSDKTLNIVDIFPIILKLNDCLEQNVICDPINELRVCST